MLSKCSPKDINRNSKCPLKLLLWFNSSTYTVKNLLLVQYGYSLDTKIPGKYLDTKIPTGVRRGEELGWCCKFKCSRCSMSAADREDFLISAGM